MKTEIYLVTDGSYSDYHIVGVFSNLEKAELAQKLYNADNIETFDLDDISEFPVGLLPFYVGMDVEGNSLRGARRVSPDGVSDDWVPGEREKEVYFSMWAEDEDHAIKIANERRIRLIESGEWTTNWKEWVKRRKV